MKKFYELIQIYMQNKQERYGGLDRYNLNRTFERAYTLKCAALWVLFLAVFMICATVIIVNL